MSTIFVVCASLAVLTNPFINDPLLGIKPIHFFWAEADDPLLNEAGWEDPRLALRYGRTEDDGKSDGELSLTLYERFLDERELTDHQRADVLAHMGLICMFGLSERDEDRARVYFKEALELAGDDILSRDLLMARTNYVGLIQDPVEQFEARLELIDWIHEMMDKTAIAEALMRRQPVKESYGVGLHGLGEVEVRTMEFDSTQMPREEALKRYESEAWRLYDLLRKYYEVQAPGLFVRTALLQMRPAEAMERLIERAEGTPIAERAHDELEYARLLQAAHEPTTQDRQGVLASPPSE